MSEEKISKDDLFVLKNEILIAEKISEDKILPQMRQALDRYLGVFVPSIANNWDILLNEIYPIIQYELPSIYFRNPRAFLKPRNKNYIVKRRNPITGQMENVSLDAAKSAKTQEALLNYTISEIRYKEEVQKVLFDALLFRHGILWHGYKGDFGMTDERSFYIENEKIFVQRISPKDFLFDPTVNLSNIDEARWIARRFEIPLKDIQEDDQLNVSKQLQGKLGYSGVLDLDKAVPIGNGGFDTKLLGSRVRTLLDYTDENFKKNSAAKFVTCYEVYKRPSKKEKKNGSKGQIILWTPDQPEPLRVNPWTIKAEGWPAKVMMMNYVPDRIFGLSDIEVYGEIADHKNLIINLQLRNAQSNSKVMVAFNKTNMDDETIKKIETGDQNIIGFDGAVNGMISMMSPGGQASGELYMLDTRIQANLDEKSGVTDLKKGMLRSGEESAASVQIRNAGTQARPAYRQDIMADFLKGSFHYINQLIKQFLPYEDAVRITGSLDIQWSDNPSKEEIQADTDVEIDVISMLPENPEKEIKELDKILQLMVEALNNPALSQKLAQEGKTFKISPIIESLLMRLKIKNPDVFGNIKPEESEGFASVSELRAAEANVEASLTGQQPPSPPAEGQDHRARLSVYQAVKRIFEMEGRISEQLEELIMIQTALAEQQQEAQSPQSGQSVRLTKPSVVSS